jgi:hypothetical protein
LKGVGEGDGGAAADPAVREREGTGTPLGREVRSPRSVEGGEGERRLLDVPDRDGCEARGRVEMAAGDAVDEETTGRATVDDPKPMLGLLDRP